MKYQIEYIDHEPNSGGSVGVGLDFREYGNQPTDQEIRDLADYIRDNVTFGMGTLETSLITTPDVQVREISLNP